tara:strand:- start:10295 stop:11242 length:948 start_codon:yes stop_codon:yes gene_type:complete
MIKKIKKQITKNLIMVRPEHFDFNYETAENNHFQKEEKKLSKEKILKNAKGEFDNLYKKLIKNKINVDVFNDRKKVRTTDSVFPNNWISLHQDGSVYVYPMFSENRRKERRFDIIEKLKKQFVIRSVIDLSYFEKESVFLEGTGSMILDRQNKICYSSISDRTNLIALNDFCNRALYNPVTFKSYQKVEGKINLIYHTNVMMCIADQYAIVCLDSIHNTKEREVLISSLEKTNKEIIEISEKQCNSFAGNMLQVSNRNDQKFLVMSSSAYKCLNTFQIKKILSYNKIIHSNLEQIEKLGGGSARCMIAENFLQKK